MNTLSKFVIISLILGLSFSGQAESIQIIQNGVVYSCNPDGEVAETCAEASLKKIGYVSSDCSKIENDSQDRCAAAAIYKIGYVSSDCLKLIDGGYCSVAALEKIGYVSSDCTKIKNKRQDRCAAASIHKIGFVSSDCLRL